MLAGPGQCVGVGGDQLIKIGEVEGLKWWSLSRRELQGSFAETGGAVATGFDRFSKVIEDPGGQAARLFGIGE